MTTKKLSISPVSLSSTDISVLKVATGILANMNIHVDILSSGDTSGAIVLVDADTDLGGANYRALNGGRGQILLVLSEQTLNDNRNVVLKKPLRVQTLKDVLCDVHQQLSTQSSGLSLGGHSAGEKTSAPSSSQAPFDAAKNLFFVLHKALNEKQRLQIFYPPFSPLYADGFTGIVATSASRTTLRRMVSAPSEQLKTLQLSEADFDILARGQVIVQFSQVLWSAALFGSQSQLVSGHDLNTPARLKAWPNFSRLDFESSHMALASLMAAQPISIRQIQEKTKMDTGVIIGFYNAALVTGLLDATAKVAAQVVPVAADSKKTGLFARIARRLNLDQPG
jgi:hypothetical protein